MTRYLAPIIHRCPACGGYFKRTTLISMHFQGEVPEWTDGKNGQWWADVGAPVGRCPICSTAVWTDDAVEVMQLPQFPPAMRAAARLWHRMTGDRNGRLRALLEWEALPDEVKHAEGIGKLESANDYIDALANLPPEALAKELYLRRRLWWTGNDHCRFRANGEPTAQQPLVPPTLAHSNMLRLLVLLEHDQNGQVTRGEILRELGRFSEAVAVLSAVPPDAASAATAYRIEYLAKTHISELRSL